MTNEQQFQRRMARASWYTYRDEKTGRVVTNAYEGELEQIQKISGVPCEIVQDAGGIQTVSAASDTVLETTRSVICSRPAGTVTLTLPAAIDWTGRSLVIKTTEAQTVVSSASNVGYPDFCVERAAR